MNEINEGFEHVAKIITNARNNAYRKVNEELILMYQRIGQFLSIRSKEASYGDKYIDALAAYVQEQFPGIKGLTAEDYIE